MFIMRKNDTRRKKDDEKPKGIIGRSTTPDSDKGDGQGPGTSDADTSSIMGDSVREVGDIDPLEHSQREKEERRRLRKLERILDLNHELAQSDGTFIGKVRAYITFGAKLNRRLSESKNFQNFITLAIVIASVMVGLQTYEEFETNDTLAIMDAIILWIFTAECCIKIYGQYPMPWKYFHDSWNQFDFIVVFICYMPVDASMVTVLRLARLLRVLKLVRALPELQVLVMGLLGSLSSIFYVAMLLMLVFYLYAVLCVTIFRDNDPVHFATLEITFLTLFRMATFEDWTDIMYTQMFGCDIYPMPFRQHLCVNPKAFGWWPAVMFISFLVLSSFVVLNLFIGVITSNMQDARDQLKSGDDEEDDDEMDEDDMMCEMIQQRLKLLSDTIGELQGELGTLEREVGFIVKSLKTNKEIAATLKKKLDKRPSFLMRLMSKPAVPDAQPADANHSEDSPNTDVK